MWCRNACGDAGTRFEDTFGFQILHGYGLSETTCYSCFMPIDIPWEQHQSWLFDHGYPSIGQSVLANEMAIFDSDGQRLAAGERGEICVRGHNVMVGYFERPDANADAFKFGWFRSGDEGSISKTNVAATCFSSRAASRADQSWWC